MHAAIDALNRWGTTWTTLVAANVWQSTVVAAVVAAALATRSSPALRYWLWQAVAIKLLLLPLWSFSIALPWLAWQPERVQPELADLPAGAAAVSLATTAVPPNPGAVGTPAANGLPSGSWSDVTWRGWLLAAWAMVVMWQLGRLAVQRARLAQLLRPAEPAGEALVAQVRQISQRLELGRVPRVLVLDYDASPFVCGLVRPALVVPRALAESLPAAEMLPVVAHELAHIRRRDLLWGWIPQLARMLYFFHPVAHLAHYQIRFERELACDQLAMQTSGQTPAAYANTLVRVLGAAQAENAR